jgi:hypothetical protein
MRIQSFLSAAAVNLKRLAAAFAAIFWALGMPIPLRRRNSGWDITQEAKLRLFQLAHP